MSDLKVLWCAVPNDDGTGWRRWLNAGLMPTDHAHRLARRSRTIWHGHLFAVTDPGRRPLEPRP